MAAHPNLGKLINLTDTQEKGLWAAWQNAIITGATRAQDIDSYAAERFNALCDGLYSEFRQSELIYHMAAFKAAPVDVQEQIDDQLAPYRPTGTTRTK